MAIVDTHLHVIDGRRLTYAWLSSYRQLHGNYLYETYAEEARRLGIETAMQMEVDVAPDEIEAETTMAEDLRRDVGPPMAGAISSCRPESPDFPVFLERQLANPFVKGFRRVLHIVPDEVSTTAVFRENLRRTGEAGLPFDLCLFARQLPIGMALADACPDVRFVLDHCGQPDIADGHRVPWAAAIAELARRPNVWIKISGIIAYVDPSTRTVDTLRPYVEHCIASFGWDRVVWGSDWPICLAGGSLSDWVRMTRQLLTGCATNEQERLLSRNARLLWRL